MSTATKSPGQIAYEAFIDQADAMNLRDDRMGWEFASSARRTCWEIAAQKAHDEGYRKGRREASKDLADLLGLAHPADLFLDRSMVNKIVKETADQFIAEQRRPKAPFSE